METNGIREVFDMLDDINIEVAVAYVGAVFVTAMMMVVMTSV